MWAGVNVTMVDSVDVFVIVVVVVVVIVPRDVCTGRYRVFCATNGLDYTHKECLLGIPWSDRDHTRPALGLGGELDPRELATA